MNGFFPCAQRKLLCNANSSPPLGQRFRRFSVMPKAICMYDDHGTPTILMTGTDFKTARGWRWRVKARRRLHLHFMVIGHPSGGLSTKAMGFFKFYWICLFKKLKHIWFGTTLEEIVFVVKKNWPFPLGASGLVKCDFVFLDFSQLPNKLYLFCCRNLRKIKEKAKVHTLPPWLICIDDRREVH